MQEKPFWIEKKLDQFSRMEWEELCDGCGKCCLVKLDLPNSSKIQYTNICCHLLSVLTCRCKSYWKRHALVPGCAVLTPQRVEAFRWLPSTCAYRLIAEGKELPSWHHLVCGDRRQVHRQGHSVLGKVISEDYIHPRELAEHITDWE